MGLITKLKSRRKDDRSTFFTIRRTKSSTESNNSGLFTRKDSPKKLTHTLSQLTIVSIPKAYKEEERFNWMTNELDSFQYKPSSDSVKATRRVTKAEKNSVKEQESNDCLVSDWLFPCWGSSPRLTDKDGKTAVTNLESRDETSYSSGSTEVQDNKEGEMLEAKPVDDVSDITSTPSEDCSEDDSEDEDCDSSCSSPAPSPRSSPVIGLEDDDALSLSSSES